MDFESRVLPELRPVLALLPQMKLPEDLQKIVTPLFPNMKSPLMSLRLHA
ncbi:hypothetical protein CLV36_101403 [Laceyella sediminis]|uniref:Uncharacterized protein n=1 Tax=Laceyella sediminis TaxID=573074 RepID=A0ABX5EVU3_9BACL|nr:hypothetical protein CLV36_101403 [Laceyella sediminis]